MACGSSMRRGRKGAQLQGRKGLGRGRVARRQAEQGRHKRGLPRRRASSVHAGCRQGSRRRRRPGACLQRLLQASGGALQQLHAAAEAGGVPPSLQANKAEAVLLGYTALLPAHHHTPAAGRLLVCLGTPHPPMPLSVPTPALTSAACPSSTRMLSPSSFSRGEARQAGAANMRSTSTSSSRLAAASSASCTRGRQHAAMMWCLCLTCWSNSR